MRAHLRLTLYVEVLIIGSIRLFFRNLVNRLMIALLGLGPLSVVALVSIVEFKSNFVSRF
jgi:hypothetical protein